jgi:hypothetical protein
MRFLVQGIAIMFAVFPSIVSAQSSYDDAASSCRQVEEAQQQQKMRNAVGTGPDVVENVIKFYSDLFGKPQSARRNAFGVVLDWTLANRGGRAHENVKPLERSIVVLILNDDISASCTVSDP